MLYYFSSLHYCILWLWTVNSLILVHLNFLFFFFFLFLDSTFSCRNSVLKLNRCHFVSCLFKFISVPNPRMLWEPTFCHYFQHGNGYIDAGSGPVVCRTCSIWYNAALFPNAMASRIKRENFSHYLSVWMSCLEKCFCNAQKTHRLNICLKICTRHCIIVKIKFTHKQTTGFTFCKGYALYGILYM